MIGKAVPRRIRLGMGLAALLLPLALACRAPGAQTALESRSVPVAPQEVRVTVNEWAFTPQQIQIPAGQPVTLVLDNRGALEHDLSIPALNVKLLAPAGRTASTTITGAKEGQYDVLCSLPGHRELGMQGKLAAGGPMQGQGAMASMPRGAPAAAPEPAHVSHASAVSTATHGNELLAYRLEDGAKVFDLKAQAFQWEVLPGEYVEAYGYNQQVPGPVLRVQEGDRVRVNFTNELPEPTVIHFHGPRLPNVMDGVPDVTQPVVAPGQQYTYEFTAAPTGTFIYHTHHNSAKQEPKGLYGLFIVDPPSGPRIQAETEVVQVLGELGGFYVINGKAFPATEAVEAKVGERVLIHLANLGQMAHPMHLHGHPFKIVATDGYPVPEGMQLTKDVVNIGPGERYDLLIELDNPGVWVFHCHILSHVENRGVEPGGMITVLKVAAS